MEVVEVRVAAICLPAVLAAVLVASEHSDGVERVGLTVVIANPCSTPEAGETSVSYPAPEIHPKWEWRTRDGMKAEKGKKKEKYVRVQSVRRRKSKQKVECRAEGVGA